MRTGRLVPALLAAALLPACSGGGGESVPVEGGGGGGGAFQVAISARPDQYDPHKTTAYPSFQVLENVYDTLVVPSAEDLTFEPSLATEWETSEDNLTWTFTLREGVTFSDGSTFSAADVVYSYNRIIDEELANAYRFETVEEVRAVDPQTVEIALTEPTPNLLAQIGAFKGMAILPEGAASNVDLATEAVGTGPFTLESADASGVTLRRNPDYWGEAAQVDSVDIRFISEGTTALTELQTGGIHWTDNIPPQQVTALEGDDSVVLGRTPSVDYWYMAVNFDRPPFDDPQVRRAISTGIGREDITAAAKFEAATVNQTAIPEQSFWYLDYAPYERDVEEARRLLSEAGAEGLSMDLMVTSEYPETVQAAQVIASQLGEIGMTVNIQTEDFSTWLDRQGRGDFDAFMLGWLGNIDPAGFYDSQHRCDASNNYHGYCNEETDRLLQEAATETDRDARKDLYDQAARQIVDDNSYFFFYNPDVLQAWRPEVSGFQTRADKAVNFETVTVEG